MHGLQRVWPWMIAIAICCGAQVAGATVIRVRQDALNPGDGRTWQTAFGSLDQALTVAGAPESDVTEIWVAAGTYVPEPDGDDPRGGTFTVPATVDLYGGFRGTESRRDERDPSLNETILSGDINGDDGPDFAHHDENVYLVVKLLGEGFDELGGTFDGFTVTGGTASGMKVLGGWTIRNCRFVANSENIFTTGVHALTGFGGGAVYVNSAAHVTFVDCTFEGNRAGTQGGAIRAWTGASAIRCRFVDNQAEENGGGAVVSNNGGGGDYAEFRDCVFENNRSSYGAGGLGFSASPALVTGCLFRNNYAEHGYGGGLSAGGQNVEVTQSVFLGNQAETAGGLAASARETVSVTSCLIVANEAEAYGGLLIDDSVPRLAANTIAFNTTRDEFYAAVGWPWEDVPKTIRNNVIWGNTRPAAPDPSDMLAAQVEFETLDDLSFSIIEGWTPQSGGPFNSGADPMFVDPLGADGMIGTLDDDFRLPAESPAVNAGDPTVAWSPGDADLDGHRRVLCGRVDIGAYESGIGDFDCNGVVDISDFTKWAACAEGPNHLVPGEPCGAYDFNADGTIDLGDFAGFARTMTDQTH